MTKLAKRLVYIGVFVVTGVLILSFMLWAGMGNTVASIHYIEGSVTLDAGVRDEYFVGEQITPSGIILCAEDKEFTGEALTLNVDNTTAGQKMVEVSHTEGNDCYRAYFPVKFFNIRHLDMRQAPTEIKFDDEGNFLGMEGLVLWAELSGESEDFAHPEGVEDKSIVELTENEYSLNIASPDENGGMTAEILCGKVTTSIYFISLGGRTFILEEPRRLLKMENMSGTDDVMTLIVTKHVASEPGKYNVDEGFYCLQRADGTIEWLNFGYYVEDGTWASKFLAAELNPGKEITEQLYPETDPQYPDHIEVMYDGLCFHASTVWRNALIN